MWQAGSCECATRSKWDQEGMDRSLRPRLLKDEDGMWFNYYLLCRDKKGTNGA